MRYYCDEWDDRWDGKKVYHHGDAMVIFDSSYVVPLFTAFDPTTTRWPDRFSYWDDDEETQQIRDSEDDNFVVVSRKRVVPAVDPLENDRTHPRGVFSWKNNRISWKNKHNESRKSGSGRRGRRDKSPARTQSTSLTRKKPTSRAWRSAVRGGACGFEFGGFKVRAASKITSKVDSTYDFADALSEARICLV